MPLTSPVRFFSTAGRSAWNAARASASFEPEAVSGHASGASLTSETIGVIPSLVLLELAVGAVPAVAADRVEAQPGTGCRLFHGGDGCAGAADEADGV